jgi:hypothetical protein
VKRFHGKKKYHRRQGSPYLTPLRWWIFLPGSPLIRKDEDEVPQRTEIT